MNSGVAGRVGTKRIRLTIVGARCATCIIPIRRALEKARGVKSVGANYVADLIVVEYDPGAISEDEIVEIIRKVGYTAIPIRY